MSLGKLLFKFVGGEIKVNKKGDLLLWDNKALKKLLGIISLNYKTKHTILEVKIFTFFNPLFDIITKLF